MPKQHKKQMLRSFMQGKKQAFEQIRALCKKQKYCDEFEYIIAFCGIVLKDYNEEIEKRGAR